MTPVPRLFPFLLLAGLALLPAAAASLEEGQFAPRMPLPALEDGRPRSLVEFRGQRYVLHVFASW